MGIQDWKLVGVFSMDDITSLAPYYSTIIAIIMGINIVFVFLSHLSFPGILYSIKKIGGIYHE